MAESGTEERPNETLRAGLLATAAGDVLRQDVRVITGEQLAELGRGQQEAYRALRRSGTGHAQAAREIGIPHHLAEEWERLVPAAAGEDVPHSGQPSEDYLRLRRLYRDACDMAARARACTEQLEQEVAALGAQLQRLERVQRPRPTRLRGPSRTSLTAYFTAPWAPAGGGSPPPGR